MWASSYSSQTGAASRSPCAATAIRRSAKRKSVEATRDASTRQIRRIRGGVYEEPALDEQFGDEYKRYREREAMAAAHHPMARVGGKDAAGASSRSAAAWLRWPIARQPKGFAVANHRPMPVAMMKAPSMTPTARKNLVCRSVISSG